MKKSVVKKIFSIVSIAILVLSVIIFSIIVVARTKGEIPSVFGYSFHIVVTDSMTPEIVEGDMVIAHKANIKDIKVGDDVLFTSPDPSLKGITIVHRVIQVLPDGGLVTQGIKQGAPIDTYPVYSIKGKSVAVSSVFGKIFMGLTNNRNLVFGAALLALLAIITSEIITIALEVYRKKLNKNSSEDMDKAPNNDENCFGNYAKNMASKKTDNVCDKADNKGNNKGNNADNGANNRTDGTD